MEAGMIEGGRGLFALCLGMSWTTAAMHILNARSMPYSRGMGMFGSLGKHHLALAAGTMAFVGILGAWVIRWQEPWMCIALLGGIALVQMWERRCWPGDVVIRLGQYSLSGSTLAGYTVTALAAPGLGLPIEQAGWEGACGVAAAAWFVAGWKKWSHSGTRWLSTQTTGLLLAERAYLGPEPLRRLRRSIVSKPWLLGTIGMLGLVLEIAGLVFCIPDLRWAFALTVVALLGLTWILFGYFEPEWALVMIALAWVT